MPGFHTLKQEGYPLTATEAAVLDSIALLGDPGADRIMFWDESSNAFAWLTAGSGLTITGTTMTASAAVPAVITVANEATDETCFPLFVTAATGDLGPKSNAGLTFNSATGVLSAIGFAGPLTGNVTGDCSGNAGTVTNGVYTTSKVTVLAATDAGDKDKYLHSNASTGVLEWSTIGGGGDVSKVGTPVDNQVGVWTGDGTIEGTTGFTYDGANLLLTGDIGATGTRITKGWFTDLTVTNAIAGAVTGNAGTVTNATLTTALTVNTGTVTLTGNVAGSVLTIGAGAVSVSGSNTGDQDLTGYVAKSLFNANTIIAATVDDTPAALEVTEQTLVGRLTGGNISAVAMGIADNNVLQIDDADAAENDYCKLTTSGVVGRSYSEVLGDIGALGTAGGTMTGNITLGENASIALDPAGSADGKYTGITVTGVAGATVAFGDLITLDKDDSRWELVDISVAAAATGDARGIMGMAVSAGNDGDAITILLNGIIRADANFPALTIGAAVYASTSGDIVVTQPSTKDYVIRIVGYALTTDEIYFNPENDWISHT